MAFLCLYQNQALADVLLPLEVMLPSGDTNPQHTPARSQSSPNPPSYFKAREMCKTETRNPRSQIWDWFLLCSLGVAILMTTCKFPEEHVPHRKGNFLCSCQESVSLSSRYGLAARTAVPCTPSQIKPRWKGQDRANPRRIQVEREPGRLPAAISAQSRSKRTGWSLQYLQGWKPHNLRAIQDYVNSIKPPQMMYKHLPETPGPADRLCSAQGEAPWVWSHTGGRKPDADKACGSCFRKDQVNLEN